MNGIYKKLDQRGPMKNHTKLPPPADTQHTLTRFNIWEVFAGLAYSHRREYIQWVESAKKA